MKYSLDKIYPPRDLTMVEKCFLNALSAYTLFFDKSLFFQIEFLQQHTELVLSREPFVRSEFPKRDELEWEIDELEKMIKELEVKQEYWELLELLREQLKKLKEALLKGEYGIKRTRLLGKYSHNHGDDSIVTLYINNIEHAAGEDPYMTMLLMGQVLLHEYFHSFCYHVGLGTQHAFSCVEEPMAEYGSLVMLDSVASSKEHIAPIANDALKYTFNKVKHKQICTGKTAAYGFGAYLFDVHKNDYPFLIARYANVSCLQDVLSKEAIEYKFMVYPTYPFKMEKIAFEKFEVLLGKKKSVFMKPKSVVKKPPKKYCEFALEVFQYIEKHGLLDRLGPYIAIKSNPNLKSLSDKVGRFNLQGIFCEDLSSVSRKSDWDHHHTFVIDGCRYYISKEWYEKGSNKRSIDELKTMIEYVYSGQFNIKKTAAGYILEELP